MSSIASSSGSEGSSTDAAPRTIGRYALHAEIAAGGMATVHIGRLLGPVGFARTVAIKRLHPPLAKDPEFVAMFLDEARLAARIRHPNVVSTLDVVATEGELFVVMEYVPGESLARLLRAVRTAKDMVPIPIAATMKTITARDFPVPAGPRINVLDPASTPPPSNWSSSAMPLDIFSRTKLERYSDATSRGNTLSPPVVMVTS